MGFGAKEAIRTLAVHGGTIEEAQHTAHLVVKLAGAVLAFLYTFYIRSGHEVIVIGIGSTHGKSVGPGAKFHVKSVLHSLVGIVSTTPVAHHHTVKLPVTLQNLVESPLIVAVMLVLVEIIGAHDGP